MTDLYLHHYPASLFSEKVRSLLGYLELPWNSVLINNIMPRPNLMELSGGYRKTPIMQDGANVFCDTKMICVHLAARAGNTSVYKPGFAATRFAEWSDSTLFRTVVALCFAPKAVAVVAEQLGAADMTAFVEDRARLTDGAAMTTLTPELAEASFLHYLRELEDSLARTSAQPFLFGSSPSIADFSLYHGLWFAAQNPVVSSLFDGFDHVKRYMEPFIAWGQVEGVASTSEAALARGSEAEPELFAYGEYLPFAGSEGGIKIGDQVAVVPDDYGKIPVVGELLHLSDLTIVVRRADPVAGAINAYFPRTGFDISLAASGVG